MNQVWEECDDGGNVNGDGCSAGCQTEETPKVCNDGIVQIPNDGDFDEQCDGSALGIANADCTPLDDYITGGTLTCGSDCLWDITSCNVLAGVLPKCGDGIVNRIEEECDAHLTDLAKIDLQGITCKGLGYETGDMACDSGCKLSFDDCSGVIDGPTGDPCLLTQEIISDCDDDINGELNFKTIRWTDSCGENIPDETIPCPAQAKLPFFSFFGIVASLTIVALVYVVLIFKKKKK